MTTTVINFKDKTLQTTDLPPQIQQTVAFYDASVEAHKKAETELVIASSASKHLLNTISAQIEQWQKEVEESAGSTEEAVVTEEQVTEATDETE